VFAVKGMERRDRTPVEPFSIAGNAEIVSEDRESVSRRRHKTWVTLRDSPSHGFLNRLGRLATLLEERSRNGSTTHGVGA
jgi:hypothetical protein